MRVRTLSALLLNHWISILQIIGVPQISVGEMNECLQCAVLDTGMCCPNCLFQNLFPQMLRVPLAGGSSLVPVVKRDTIPQIMATSLGSPNQWVVNAEITKPGPSSTLRTMLKGHPSFRVPWRASGSLCWNCQKSSSPLCPVLLLSFFFPFSWYLSQVHPQIRLL